jgi:predicted DNA binding protein
MRLELERIVPTGNQVMPFIWATGQEQEAFEEMVRTHPAVKELQVLDRIGDNGLYRIEWEDAPTDLLEGIARTDAVILEARGDSRWSFRLRFPDHERLSAFHDYLIDRGVHVEIKRTYTLTDSGEHGHQFDLTEAQRKALVLATERGYFDVPRGTTLDELADNLGITRQALSERIRRGSKKMFDSTLRSSTRDPG